MRRRHTMFPGINQALANPCLRAFGEPLSKHPLIHEIATAVQG